MVILNIQQIIIELFASNNISYIFKERSCFFYEKITRLQILVYRR